PPFLTSSLLFAPPPRSTLPTLSLHDALPILMKATLPSSFPATYPAPFTSVTVCGALSAVLVAPTTKTADKEGWPGLVTGSEAGQDRKSTRLNSTHVKISYAVFCLKKKNKKLY